jgi:hypothetical protein
MRGNHDPGELAQLEAKLQPERIRATLSFAGLYQLTHEMIKQAVLDQVRSFYLRGFDESGYLYDEDSYRAQVLSRHKQKFRASLLWLVESNAITLAQADRLQEIQDHRHDLTHELVKYIADVKFEPKLALFVDALTILRDLNRFWTQVEIDIGTFDGYGDITTDDAIPLSLHILQLCVDAYGEGLSESSEL